jgi:hypothetical protein
MSRSPFAQRFRPATGTRPWSAYGVRSWLHPRFYEYTPFCNGPDEVKSPCDRHAAELTLPSVVDAGPATLCC